MMTRVFNVGFSLLLSLSISSCNKEEEFYEKEFLDTPTSGSTNGSVEGGSQGGVDSGVDGGTTGSSTNGSSTGGVDGSTIGGVDGTTVGGTTGVDGSTIGGVDGTTVGGTTGVDGSTIGGVDGTTVGGTTGVDGSTIGGVDGTTVGGTVGGTTGGVDGSTIGGTDGGTTGGTAGGTTGGTYGDCNNGHGNDVDGVDESNPTIGTEPKCKLEIFHQTAEETKKIDIVWIVDNSGSMSDEQNALGTNFSAFINDFITKNVDFKMAITTTDASTVDKKGKMVTDSDLKLNSAAAQANEAQFKTDFNSMIKVGISGSGNEKGLAASEGFMEKYSNSFVRQDAYLAVVVVSDEEDQSSKTVAQYTDYLKSFKSSTGMVKVYSVVDVNNTNCCQNGITTGSERYKAASKNTAGMIADIRDDFHGVLSDMGESIINLLDSFALANEPIPGTLRVYVNDVESTNYTYDSASHSIKFNSNSLPPVGAEIKIYYVK